MMFKTLTIFFTVLPFTIFSQIPEGYYDDAEGLNGQELRTALEGIIDNHDDQSYASLWIHFQSTDSTAEGKVWDMYSDVPGGTPDYVYTFVIDQCGNYSGEGSCYNREHSFPKSWFGGAIPPMNSDMFHVVPSDGYTNGQRGNYPYGDVGTASWTSTNGSKKGNCVSPGYTGTVFEPIDEYKGDFARGYFYMLTRYMDDISSWDSPMLSGSDFSGWAKDLLLEWAENDTVSTKEINRNNEIYAIQENRNPFIDHPEYAQLIWDLSASIEESIVIQPNVFYQNSTLYISNNQGNFENVFIYSYSGQMIYNSTISMQEENIPIDLQNGMYILDFNSQNSRASVKLLVINN